MSKISDLTGERDSLVPATEQRRTGIGGHDIAAICGLHPFLTPLDVYLEKVHGISHFVPEYLQRRGLYLEEFLLTEYLELLRKNETKQLYRKFSDVFWREKNHNYFYAHPDAVFYSPSLDDILKEDQSDPSLLSKILKRADEISPENLFIVECKAPGMLRSNQWGEEGSFEIPDYIKCQAAWYCGVLNLNRAQILVDSSFKLKIYTYDRDEELEAELFSAAEKFWNHNIVKQIEPCPGTVEESSKKFNYSCSDKSIQLTEDIVRNVKEYKELSAHIKELEKEAAEKRLAIQNYLCDSEYGTNESKLAIVSWKPQVMQRLDTIALKNEKPEIYKEYLTQTRFRRFTVR